MTVRTQVQKVPFNDLALHHQRLQPAISEAFAQLLRSSSFVRGAEVDKFEKEFAAAVGVPSCVSCGNGTDALYITLKALGANAGDEVLTTAHSWIATSETITQTGATVVFCDTDHETFTIDPADIERKITAQTRGIIPVHLFGQPADMSEIMRIARKHKLWVIEDCAQAHMARYNGATVGTFGDAATFSFYPGKNLGAIGDAGAFVTQRADIAEWGALFARHGGKGDHLIEGINSRMDGLQGAVLRLKLPHLAAWTSARRAIAKRYDERLKGCGDIEIPAVAEGRDHVYHLYVIRTEHRDDLKAFLVTQGVETLINYPKALPFYPAYIRLGARPQDFPNAFANQSRILSLPIFPEMTEEQQDYVVGAIALFFGNLRS
ncbi:MAG TPA: DegT/DnrJ/EryC1/StrS family aminotransferase [Gemmatimonadaceae bacterium]|nr:DegT/DnrJ/EryC1/StrS family aminotransferase [Gemmatimonadaceae bacterium]